MKIDLKIVLVLLAVSLTGCGSNSVEKRVASKKSVSDKQIGATKLSPINDSLNITLDPALEKLNPQMRRSQSLVFLKMAKGYEDSHDHEKCVEAASIAIKLNPTLAEAYLIRAEALHSSAYGDDKLALADAKRAVELDPGVKKGFLYLGKLYDSQKEHELAIQAFDNAIKQNPRDRESLNMKAGSLRMLGRLREAIDCYTVIIKMFPHKSSFYIRRGNLHECLEEWDKAIADYSSATEIEKDGTGLGSTQAFRARGKLYSILGKRKESIADFSKVIELDRYDEESLRLRGLEYERLNDYHSALNDFTRSIEFAPEYERASYEDRARVYKKMGRVDLCKADLARAKAIKRKPAEIPIYTMPHSKE